MKGDPWGSGRRWRAGVRHRNVGRADDGRPVPIAGQPRDDYTIEVHLEDGGHVVVTFVDRASRLGASDAIAQLLVLSDGSEPELEEAILSEATELGFVCSASQGRHPTVVLVGRRRDRGQPTGP